MGFPIKWDKPRTPTDKELEHLRKYYDVYVRSNGDIAIAPRKEVKNGLPTQ